MAVLVFSEREWNKDKPTLSWALSCSDAALNTYWEDNRRDKNDIHMARSLFRAALSRGADPRPIYLAWYVMELRHRDTAAARGCFYEWRWRSGGGGERGDGDPVFWCHYAWFEWEHGKAKRARAVAKAAVAACPREPVVFAVYSCLGQRMRCDRHARRIVGRARDVLSVDEDAVKEVAYELLQYRNDLREATPTVGDVFRCLCCFFCARCDSAYRHLK